MPPKSENYPVTSRLEQSYCEISVSETSRTSYDSEDSVIKSIICESQLNNSKDKHTELEI